MVSVSSNRLELNRLRYFAAVVDTGAFTRAAERLGVTKAVVSQQVARLEEELGVTLLLRTTRKLALTEAGRKLHTRCVAILRESAEALVELTEGAEEPSGMLRITAPVDYGLAVVMPVVASFAQAHPRCSVEVSLTDRIVDVQTVDLAVRVGWLRDSSHISRRIGVMDQYLVCSRELAGKLRRVREPQALAALPFVVNLSLADPTVWHFVHPRRGRRTARVQARITVDATTAVHAAVLAGGGVSVLPDYAVAADLGAGRLVRLLPEWKLRSGGIYVLVPSARFRPAKISRFLELLSRAAAALHTVSPSEDASAD
jgi:DNA-binding transcriptional LysR family regulator